MGVRDITGRSALLQAEIAESDIKDKQPDRVPGQDVAGVVAGPLQVLAKPQNKSAGASRPGNATQAGTQFASVRQKRDTTSSSAPGAGAGQAGGVGSASSTTAASGTGATAATTSTTVDPIGAQREEFKEFYSLSGQAEVVFNQKPRPSPRRDAQDAFEKAFPAVKRPVDLDKLYVNTYRQEEKPPGSSRFEYTLVSSRSVADLIADRYCGGQEITLDNDAGTYHGIYHSSDALYSDDVDLDDENTVGGITPQELEKFINGLPADKAKDVKARDARFFRTPGEDGKTPVQKLGEIRGTQIQAEAKVQYDDKTLSPEGKALVDSVVKNPTQAGLDRAFPNEGSRPRVFSLSIDPRSTLEDGEPVADKTLYGPLVMMTPHADNLPGESDRVVLYLPGQGLKEFKSVEDMKGYVDHSRVFDREQSRALLNFLPEQDQADSSRNWGYELGGFKDVPPGKNFFEHSVEQQVDKQGRDTEYRMAQAGERGVDLTELDQIVGASSDDLRESFDADGPLKERDLRLIEENRPDWWETSSPEDKAALGNYQEAADQLENNFEELQSGIPDLEEFAAGKIREELQAKYPGIDPDKTAVTIGYYQPPEGPTRLNPNPQPQYKTITVTLTEYVVLERRLAQNPPNDDTGFSGTVLDSLVPGSDFAKLFRENKVSVTATLRDTDGNAITDTSGKAVTLDKNELNALAGKLDIGKGYKELLNDKYLGVNGQTLQSTWKAAYLARMQADAQEARMSGEIDALYDDKTPSRMVQAVLKSPDSQKREKVNGHDIRTEEFTVDIERKFPLPSSVSASYPVNGVLVIGAADRGLATVVLYTPDAPDGKAFRTYRSREDMKKDPMFKQPEWVAYFKGRVSHGKVSVSREKDMTEQEGIDLYAKPDAKSNYETKFNTKLVVRDFTDQLYKAEVSSKLDNADAFSITNDELHQESLQKKISAGIG
uniref:dermonecrotic toxin domain-containing protein n=1 Tax=Burkholderia pyrrocinia TaxID=60550 RepID=UPI001ABBC81C